jgi:predicted RNase H-like HicB family nuclease
LGFEQQDERMDEPLSERTERFSAAMRKKTLMQYQVILEESEEGFAVSVPGLPGCHSQGASEAEALENISDAIREYLGVVSELGRGKKVRNVLVEA